MGALKPMETPKAGPKTRDYRVNGTTSPPFFGELSQPQWEKLYAHMSAFLRLLLAYAKPPLLIGEEKGIGCTQLAWR